MYDNLDEIMKAHLSYIFCNLGYYCTFENTIAYFPKRKKKASVNDVQVNHESSCCIFRYWLHSGLEGKPWFGWQERCSCFQELQPSAVLRSMHCQTLFGNRIRTTTQLFYASAAKEYHLSLQDFMQPLKIFCAIFSRQQKWWLNMKISIRYKLNNIKCSFVSSFGLCSEDPDALDLEEMENLPNRKVPASYHYFHHPS